MADLRTIDLEGEADSRQELRLQLLDCVVSIWLPASAATMGKAMAALADIGFDVPERPPSDQPPLEGLADEHG